LSRAFSKVKVNGTDPVILKLPYASFLANNRYLNYPWFLLSHLVLSFKAFLLLLKSREKFLIIREFSNWISVFNIPFFYFFKNRLLLNINHNIKNANLSVPLPIKILCFFGFKFIFFDGMLLKKTLLKKINANFIFPFFPIDEEWRAQKKVKHSKRLTIGIVGDFRSEKICVNELLLVLDKINKSGLHLKIGLRSSGLDIPEWTKGFDVVLTNSQADYRKFLSALNVIIIFARRDSYFSRHSGTIMDAIASNVIPIVPKFPVFCRQVFFPKPVGFTYDDLNDLLRILTYNFPIELRRRSVCVSAYKKYRFNSQNLLMESSS